MVYRRTIVLTADQRQALVHLRDHSSKPYLRERAAAVLKVADGACAAVVARTGLLHPHDPDIIYGWLNRYARDGIAGLTMRPGRGRKPAFSPSASRRRPGPDRAASPAQS